MEGIISVCEGEGCYSQSEQTLKWLFDLLLEGIKQSTDPTQTRFIHHYLDKLLLLSPEERDKLVKEMTQFDGLENVVEHFKRYDQNES
ncbi:MAG TPA: hypothetical protein VK044_00595 [Virgibacillus sp.]|nr:hypothetical protein [Virgibacillus sp.]